MKGLQKMRTIALGWLVTAALFPLSVQAAPTVEGFDLVSTTRTGRTAYDYTYRLRVRGDMQSYKMASFTVSSAVATTKVVDAAVTVEGIDAGAFIRPSDTFTIRQDRLVAFDSKALTFSFFGQPMGLGTGVDAPRIGPLTFLEDGGRPEHEGSFPIQGESPLGGINIVMRMNIYGNVGAASYRFLSASSAVLAEAALIRAYPQDAESTEFIAGVTTPLEPFTVEIVAIGEADSQQVVWRSARLYRPPALALRILPAHARLARGEEVDVTLRITPATGIRGDYKVLLSLPAELSGQKGPWVVSLRTGLVTEVTTRLTASTLPETFGPYTIAMEAVSVANPAEVATATLQMFVE